MRTFKHFPGDKLCPICKTNLDKECVLIAIYGTFKENIAEAIPTHANCLMSALVYYPMHGVIAAKAKQ